MHLVAEPADIRADELPERRDRRAVERIAGGDEDALRNLFRRYSAAANGLAVRIVGDRTLAEEILQDVFLAVWRKARSYDPHRGSVRSWLMMQVHHRAVDVVRHEESARRRSTEHAGPQEPPPSPEDVVEEAWLVQRRADVRGALRSLPDEQRTVVELAYFGGLTQTQVAERVGAPLGTVKSRTLAALRKLRTILGAEGAS